MKLSIEMHRTLALINAALLKGDDQTLEKAFEGVELAELLSQQTITVVRGLGKGPLVMLLCTLAEHNDVEVPDAKRWLAAYQSIARKKLHFDLSQLAKNNVWRLAVENLVSQKSFTLEKIREIGEFKGTAQEWQDALELLIDHRDWKSALTILQHLGSKLSEKDVLARIAHSLSSRHPLYVESSGVSQVDVDYRVLSELYQLCADAAQKADELNVHCALMHLAASALETAGDHLAALRIIDKTDPEELSLDAQFDAARCLCKSGDLLKSISRLDQILFSFLINELNMGKDEQPSIKLDTAQQTRPEVIESDALFDIESANRALGDLSEIANTRGTPIFLVSGTLLGCIREGALLSHDKDIDVGIFGWENQYDLCMALHESGIFTISMQHLKAQDTFYIPVCHNETGMWIDIFVYHPHGPYWITGVDFYFGHRQTFRFTPFELKQVKFLGLNMNIPANPELNLMENYGDWMLPDSSYISHLESPSTMNKGELPYMLTARLMLLSALSKISISRVENKFSYDKKIKKIILLMKEYKNFPGGMSDKLIEQFDVLLN